MEKLAKYVYATHIKDLKPQKGVAADEWYFFSSAPVGDGIVDNMQLARLLARAGYRPVGVRSACSVRNCRRATLLVRQYGTHTSPRIRSTEM